MVIGFTVGIACIIAIVFTLYFCRCYKWGHETNDIFKDVDKDLQDTYKEPIPSKPIITNGQIQSTTTLTDPKMDWTEMSEMSSPNSGKRTSYERSGSKDSMQVKKK